MKKSPSDRSNGVGWSHAKTLMAIGQARRQGGSNKQDTPAVLSSNSDLNNYWLNYPNNGIVFDYKLRDGRATGRNAIKLLQLMGYSPAIAEEAEKRANVFVKQGICKEISS
jgi:hypothetical protein